MKYCFAFSLMLAAAAVSCSKSTASHAEVDSVFRSAVPANAQTLFSMKLDKLKASELYRRHQQLLDLPQLNAMGERLGLDPRRDLSNMLVVWDGSHLLLLAEGALDSGKLEAKLTADGAQKLGYRNFTLFTRGGTAVSFPDRGLAIVGSDSMVKSTLDLRSSNGGAAATELQERLTEIPSDAQMWEVSRGGLPAANINVRSDIDSALSNISAFVSGTSFGARFDSGTHMQARIVCKSAEGAQRVNDALRGLIGLARLSTNDNQLDLLRMWDAVSISKDEQAVRVSADLPADLSDKLIAQLVTMRGRAGAILRSQ